MPLSEPRRPRANLGGSGPASARLVVGTAQLSQAYGVANVSGPLNARQAISLLQLAAARGVGGFDTAPGYGTAETLIGRAGVATPVFTKLAPAADPAKSVRASLSRLNRSHVDALLLHDPDALARDEPTVARAAALVGGPVGLLGVSVYTGTALAAAIADPRIGMVQVPASVADRRFLDHLPLAAEAGMVVLVRSVFLQGALLVDPAVLPPNLRPLGPVVQTVRRLADLTQMAPATLLVAFVRHLPGVSGVVLGCETKAQLLSNLEAVAAPELPPSVHEELSQLPALPTEVLDPRAWAADVPEAPGP